MTERSFAVAGQSEEGFDPSPPVCPAGCSGCHRSTGGDERKGRLVRDPLVGVGSGCWRRRGDDVACNSTRCLMPLEADKGRMIRLASGVGNHVRVTFGLEACLKVRR